MTTELILSHPVTGAPVVPHPAPHSEVRQLICEGACNTPLRQRVDARVAEFRHGVRESIQVSPVDDLLRHDLRALTHTPHRQRFVGRWVCTVCGGERRY